MLWCHIANIPLLEPMITVFTDLYMHSLGVIWYCRNMAKKLLNPKKIPLFSVFQLNHVKVGLHHIKGNVSIFNCTVIINNYCLSGIKACWQCMRQCFYLCHSGSCGSQWFIQSSLYQPRYARYANKSLGSYYSGVSEAGWLLFDQILNRPHWPLLD